ncbi:MAG: ABC transporter substrate-binding protein [Patulibacter sp.]|nr:ABC transporter substrate-binding protein [Patulibacter sp.]
MGILERLRARTAVATVAAALLCGGALAACGDDDGGDGGGGASNSAAPAGATTGGSGGIDESKDPIHFSLISIKIPGVHLLDYHQAGAEAAAKKINADGGIGGREVIIDTCNSMMQPAVATNCARKTLENEPTAQLGCETTWSATGLKLYARAEIPSFNCVNTPDDFNNEWSFGLSASAVGGFRGVARYACQNPEIEKIVVFTQDLPQQRREAPASVDPVVEECGKSVSYVYYPLTGADLSPFISKAVKEDPDFVITLAGAPMMVQMFRGFQQAGIPASKISAPDSGTDYETVLAKADGVMDGAIISTQFVSWGQPEDPEVQGFLEAMKASGTDIDARNSSAVWGYQSVMWFNQVAQEIGPENFNAKSLAEFMRTKTGVDMILSREIENPGPKGYPQIKQPYVQIVRWDGEKERMVPVEENTDGGWVRAF